MPADVLTDLGWGGEGTTWYPHIRAVEWRSIDGRRTLVASTDLRAQPARRDVAAKVCVQMGAYALEDDGTMWPILVAGAKGEKLVFRGSVSDSCGTHGPGVVRECPV